MNDATDPNTSSQAKRHAEDVLDVGSGTTTETISEGSDDLHQTRVNAGYKSTLKSEFVVVLCDALLTFCVRPQR